MPDTLLLSSASPITEGSCPVGKGLFASRRIRKADLILRFTGPVINEQQALEKGHLSFNVLQIGTNSYMDLEEPGVILNHSCAPNAGIVDDTVLIAIRDIMVGEEITYDYSTTMSEKLETMECLCGEKGCRRIIGDFHDLPATLKDRYLAARLVQDFIVREHRERMQSNRLLRSMAMSPQRGLRPAKGASSAFLARKCA